MATVEVQGIKKYFGDVRALDGVDLFVEDGEFLVLLGPSGSGKTTLMRIIAGLEKPTSGKVLIDGKEVNELPPRVRNVAMVFQSYALYPHMRAFDNIAFPLKTRRVPKSVTGERVRSAAQMLRIDRLLGRKPRELSGGERQRVALARAIVRDPVVFLMDEPLSNLDAQLRAAARDELKQFQRRVGITTIFVTHDQVEALGLGDRIAVMNLGKVHQVGTPEEVYNRPADTFVATFLGSPPMNLVRLPDVIVGFRPEHFVPAKMAEQSAAADDVLHIPLEVSRVEFLGAEQIIYGTIRKGNHAFKVTSRLPVSLRVHLKEGETHAFAVTRSHLRFFDPHTEKAIPAPSNFQW